MKNWIILKFLNRKEFKEHLWPLFWHFPFFSIGIWRNFEWSSVHCSCSTNAHNTNLSRASIGILWTNAVEDLSEEEMALLIIVPTFIARNTMKQRVSAPTETSEYFHWQRLTIATLRVQPCSRPWGRSAAVLSLSVYISFLMIFILNFSLNYSNTYFNDFCAHQDIFGTFMIWYWHSLLWLFSTCGRLFCL